MSDLMIHPAGNHLTRTIQYVHICEYMYNSLSLILLRLKYSRALYRKYLNTICIGDFNLSMTFGNLQHCSTTCWEILAI